MPVPCRTARSAESPASVGDRRAKLFSQLHRQVFQPFASPRLFAWSTRRRPGPPNGWFPTRNISWARGCIVTLAKAKVRTVPGRTAPSSRSRWTTAKGLGDHVVLARDAGHPLPYRFRPADRARRADHPGRGRWQEPHAAEACRHSRSSGSANFRRTNCVVPRRKTDLRRAHCLLACERPQRRKGSDCYLGERLDPLLPTVPRARNDAETWCIAQPRADVRLGTLPATTRSRHTRRIAPYRRT